MSNQKATKSKKQSKEDIEKRKKELGSTIALLPFKKPLNNGNTGYEMKGNTFLNIFEICSQDYPNKAEVDVQREAALWDRFRRTKNFETKIINLSLPIDVKNNISYLKKKLEQTSNMHYKKIINESIQDFQKISQRQSEKSCLFVFTTSYEELVKANLKVMSSLSGAGLIKNITPEAKVDIINKLTNPNS